MRILHSPRTVIETDMLKATKTLPLRVRAFSRMDYEMENAVTLSWNDMLSFKQNHDLAAERFVEAKGWGIDLIGYRVNKGFIFVNAAPDARARTAAEALNPGPARKATLVRGKDLSAGTWLDEPPSA
jgi:hypothetical protein